MPRRIEFQPFTKHAQQITQKFMLDTFHEMNWTPEPADGLDNLEAFFHLSTNQGFLFIATNSDQVVATGGCKKLNEQTGLVKRFYVEKELRGTGVAQQLLEKIIYSARKEQLSRLVLDVPKDNSRAIRFYERNGFALYHQTPIADWSESFTPDIYNYYFLNLEIK